MLKNKIESLLFSSGRKMDVDELSRLLRANPDEVQNALTELKKDYEERDSSTMLVDEGNSWKLTVREKYLPLVQKIVTETELSKTVTETLAVVAFKYPIKQSDLIKIRTNKAYDHLKELEEIGYITRQKHGRTNLIKLTQKFFEYFDLSEGKLKEKFQDFKSIARAVEEKEKEIEAIKQEQKAKAEEEKQKDEKIKEEIDLLDQEENKVPLATYENKKPEEEKKQEVKIIEDKEKIGDLEVVDEPSEEELEEERERIQQIKDEDKEQEKIKEETQQQKKVEDEAQQPDETDEEEKQQVSEKVEKHRSEGGIKVNEEMEKMIDEKVEKMLHPKKETSEENKKEKQEESEE